MSVAETPAAATKILAADHPGAQPEQERAAQGTAFAIAARLARTHPVPAALLTLLDGPLGAAVAHAGEYAGDSLAPATKRVYERDWDVFAAWCTIRGIPSSRILAVTFTNRPAKEVGDRIRDLAP